MEAIIFEKVPSQQHSQVQKTSNSVHFDGFVSPRNRLNVINMNQIVSRNPSFNKINKISSQLSHLQSIVSNVETPKQVASDNQITHAPSNPLISNSITDEHPVRSVKNQPRISNNPHLPSVFSTDKAHAIKIKKLIKNQILSNYDELSVEQEPLSLDPFRQSTPNHRNRSSKSFLSPTRVVSPTHISSNVNLAQRPSFNHIYGRSEKAIRPANNTRESARRIPTENLFGLKSEESYINASNNSGMQSSSSNSKKKIIIFKKFLSKSPENNIPVLDGITNQLSSAMKLLNKLSSPMAKLKSKISLNEMITLRKVRTTQSNGIIKRMLHAPSLNIYDIQEEPIKGPESLKEWINLWKRSFTTKENKHLLKIFTCFWNSPEGSVSVLLEAANKNSLQDMLEMHFSLPESCIQQLATSLINGLQEVHTVMKESHGAICPSEVFFDSQFQPKLSPGISRHATAQSASSQQSNEKESDKEESSSRMLYFKQAGRHAGELRSCSPKVSQQSARLVSKKLPQQFAADIFDFGYLLLTCALGSLEFYDSTGFLNPENLKQVIELYLNNRRPGRNDCCLLHNEADLRKFYSGLNSTTKLRNTERKSPLKNNFQLKSPTADENNSLSNKKVQAPFSLLELLQKNNRCSDSFIDFLCNCLRLQGRPEARSPINHVFLSTEHVSSGPLMKLSELIATNQRDAEPQTSEKLNEEHLDRVCEAIKIVLMNGDAHEKMRKFAREKLYENPQTREHRKLQDLANELGVPIKKVLEKFQQEIFTDL